MLKIPDFPVRDGVLCAEDIPLPELAREYGTPLYVYSAAHIREQYRALAGAFKNILPADRQPLICYAVKANSHIAILSLLKDEGCGMEIVSEGELVRSLKAGVDPSKIVSTGVGKQRSEIIAQLKAGIHQINVESLEELAHIQLIASDIDIAADIVFRLNPDVTGGGHSKISTGRKGDKFGILVDDVKRGFAMAQDMSHVNAVGLSVHIGSQVFNVSAFEEAFGQLPDIVHDLRGDGYTIDRLDIGGGFPIQYTGSEGYLDFDLYAKWVADIIAPLNTQIILEPGRYMVGNSGVLLTEILYVKETENTDFLVIDAAMNDLLRPAMYDAYHDIQAVSGRDRPARNYDIVGPICETGDTFTKARTMPEMNSKDLVAIMSAGAYGMCMSSHYNTRPRAAEVLVSGGRVHQISQRETYDDLLAREMIARDL